jgi:hypothetical protein
VATVSVGGSCSLVSSPAVSVGRADADGGLLVLPYTGPHHPCGLAVLSVRAGTALGRIVDDNAGFMPLRGQRLSTRELDEIGQPGPVVLIEVGPHGQRVTPSDHC